MQPLRQLVRLCWFIIAVCALAVGDASEPKQTVSRSDPSEEQAWEKREAKLLRQFERKLVELLSDAEVGCVDCHSSETMSNLVLTGEPLRDLRHLLDAGYLKEQGPDTLLGRVRNAHPDRRMPKEADVWNRQQIAKLEKFVDIVSRHETQLGIASDEQFPRSLLLDSSPIHSNPPPAQFLSYRQLRGKIAAIFADDGVRGDRDLFAENIAAFAGADFKTRFNESREPTASYLSALEAVSREVASRAFRQRTGPFASWSLAAEESQTPAQQVAQIEELFQHILFRAPTSTEVQQSLELLSSVRGLEQTISERNSALVFEVTVTDPELGMSASETVSLPISGQRVAVRQTVVDQTSLEGQACLGRVQLGPATEARVVLHNQGTYRQVNLAGITLKDLEGNVCQSISVDAPTVSVEGAWIREDEAGHQVLSDKNQHKGLSTISVALQSATSGEFDVFVQWLPNPRNASNVLCELHGTGVDPALVAPQINVAAAEPHTAQFFFDCSNDAVPFVELPGSYQFTSQGFIELSNQGTLEQVTAGAIELINVQDPADTLLLDSQTAAGVEAWDKFDEGRFKAYNVRGLKVHDNNTRKGELSLRYRLADCKKSGWQESAFYRVRVYYPGKRDQEPRVPVKVVAERSSPIVQVTYPLSAPADSLVRLEARGSYTTQASDLQFRWRQVAGPPVQLSDSSSASVEFVAPRQSAEELAWVSLVAGLLRHPDFLFTHAPSIDALSGHSRQRLLLAKIAIDLLGRPPTQAEFQRLAADNNLSNLVDAYLDSPEFRDYYFHRVRLYLESQGTELQDEPARLWCYIAFEDRPFQELLTAEYTVDEAFKQVSRPAHHGKTGLLTTPGFIDGKPGLPHYNYAAQVSMLFLGYVYEVPAEIVELREGSTALGTADPNSSCYSCHKILTPLALQRLNWTDAGEYREQDEEGLAIDATDRGVVAEYPFKGAGLEAFATQAVKKERFVRTIINTHVDFYFGRQMDYRQSERGLYKRLWDHVHANEFKLRPLIKAIILSPEYLGSEPAVVAAKLPAE